MINYILSKSNIMINYVGFTIVWFSCVYSGAKGDPIIAIIPTLCIFPMSDIWKTAFVKLSDLKETVSDWNSVAKARSMSLAMGDDRANPKINRETEEVLSDVGLLVAYTDIVFGRQFLLGNVYRPHCKRRRSP